MQQSPSIHYFTIVLVIVFVMDGEAKRGCSLYGHSCYGGHGKRSDQPNIDLLPVDRTQAPSNENQLESNNGNQWKSKNEFNQALYFLRRWISEARKNSEDTVPAPETDTIFENTFV